MTKILVLTTSYPRSQADDSGIFVARLVTALSNEGISGSVIVPLDGTEPQQERANQFEIRRFKYWLFSTKRLAFGAGIMPNLRAAPSLAFQIPGMICKMALVARRTTSEIIPRVIWGNWISALPAAIFAACFKKIPIVMTLRGEDVKISQSPLIKPFVKQLMKKVSKIVTVSEELREELLKAKLCSEDKILVIENGVEIPAISKDEALSTIGRLGIGVDLPYLLAVGSVIPRKHLESLLELISEKPLSQFRLVIAGRLLDSRYLEKLKKRARELSCEDRVLYLGPIEPDLVPHLLSHAYAFVSASEYEGRPNALLEALASGVPACVSDIPAHQALIREDFGYLFGHANLNEAASWIESFRHTPQLRLRASQGAIDSIRRFSWKNSAQEYKKLFEKI